MHQNKQNVQSSKTSLYQKDKGKQNQDNTLQKQYTNHLKQNKDSKTLFSANKIDSKLLMKLMKNLSNAQLDNKDKEIQKQQKLEQQDENMFKEVKHSDRILKGVLKLNLMKNYTVGYNHNTMEKCQLILQNFQYRPIRAMRIQKSIYKVVLIYYSKFFDFITQIQIRQNAMINFSEFLHEFFNQKNRQLKKEFYNGYNRLNKAFNIFEFQRNKDLNNWKDGCFEILKDYDRQPKSMMSLVGNNSNYLKFLTFFDHFQRLQIKNNKEDCLKNFFNKLKNDYKQVQSKRDSLKQLSNIFKKNQKNQKKHCYDLIYNKKSKLQAQFLVQSVYLVKLNKVKKAFDQIKSQPKKQPTKQSQTYQSSSPDFKGTQARFKIQKNMSRVNIMNVPKRRKLDLEAFIKYIEYLRFLREKHAFYKILMSQKAPKEEKVIHGRISILKRPIEYEEYSDQYKQHILQDINDPETSSNWIRQDSINHAISQRNLGFGQLHQSQINLNPTTQSVSNFKELSKKYSQIDLRQRVKQRNSRPPPPGTLGLNTFKKNSNNLNKSGIIVRKKQKWTKNYQPSFIEENTFRDQQDRYQQNVVSQSQTNFYPGRQPENQQNKNNIISKISKTYRKTKNGQVVKKTTKRTTTKRSYIKQQINIQYQNFELNYF